MVGASVGLPRKRLGPVQAQTSLLYQRYHRPRRCRHRRRQFGDGPIDVRTRFRLRTGLNLLDMGCHCLDFHRDGQTSLQALVDAPCGFRFGENLRCWYLHVAREQSGESVQIFQAHKAVKLNMN